MTAPLVPARPFSQAKAGLSELMSEVVRKHRPHVIERGHGRERMALIGAEELDTLLRTISLVPDVIYGAKEVTMSLAPLGLVASGPSLEAAADAMLEDLRQYAGEFIERYDYFRHTDRRGDLPWVLRFALTPPEAQRDLLFEKPAAALSVLQERSAPQSANVAAGVARRRS